HEGLHQRRRGEEQEDDRHGPFRDKSAPDVFGQSIEATPEGGLDNLFLCLHFSHCTGMARMYSELSATIAIIRGQLVKGDSRITPYPGRIAPELFFRGQTGSPVRQGRAEKQSDL